MTMMTYDYVPDMEDYMVSDSTVAFPSRWRNAVRSVQPSCLQQARRKALLIVFLACDVVHAEGPTMQSFPDVVEQTLWNAHKPNPLSTEEVCAYLDSLPDDPSMVMDWYEVAFLAGIAYMRFAH